MTARTRRKHEVEGGCSVGMFTLDRRAVGRAEFAKAWGARYPEHWELVQEMLALIEKSDDGFLYKWVWHYIYYVVRAAEDHEAYLSFDEEDAEGFTAQRCRDSFRATLENYSKLLRMLDEARERRDADLVGLLDSYRKEGLFDESRWTWQHSFLWMCS